MLTVKGSFNMLQHNQSVVKGQQCKLAIPRNTKRTPFNTKCNVYTYRVILRGKEI